MATLTLQKCRGALALQGLAIDQMVVAALNSSVVDINNFLPIDPKSYHITLLTKQELKLISPEKISAIKPDTSHVFALGVGGKPSSRVYWIVIIWAAGQQIRKRLGLSPKHFHITLSSDDIHEIDKGIASLLVPISPGSLRGDVLDHVIFTLQSFGQYTEAKAFAIELALDETATQKGWLRLADAALNLRQVKLAMLSYACAWERVADSKPQSYCLKRLIECCKETEWGHVFGEEEIPQLDTLSKNVSTLLAPWSESLKNVLREQKLSPTFSLEPRYPLLIPHPVNKGFYKLPRFFRWLVPHYFAIMSTPRNEDDINALSSPCLAIRHVLTLTQETPLPESWFRSNNISNTFLPIPNYHPPTVEQMDIIIQLFKDERNTPLLVHCGGGKGRAGTIAACYLVAYGFSKPSLQQDHPEMSAEAAISALRSLRPGSLETSQQENFVSTWCSTIWKRQSVYPDLPSEPPPCPLEIHGDFDLEKSDFLVLVGLPGSGKTWFTKSLVARDNNAWHVVSQDEIGSRAFCETAVGRKPQKSQRVLLDRCNTSAEDRKQWLELASNWCTSPICVWFDYDAALCTARAQMRANHPTLIPGNRVRNAVKQMREMFTKPTLQEGWRAILLVKSFEAALEAVLRFHPLTICKFPRTPHLIDVGAATVDDVHTDLANFQPLSRRTRIVITEKIDGANMGFSLSSCRDRIVVQNRSHYVNSTSHEQFKKLNAWLVQHDQDLRHVLDRDPYFAERYILFGEWAFATHSIAYTELPDWFLAYDLYDRSSKTFVCTSGLEAILAGTSIRRVPILFEGERMPHEE
jgi:atypical dual specificity phosphatase